MPPKGRGERVLGAAVRQFVYFGVTERKLYQSIGISRVGLRIIAAFFDLGQDFRPGNVGSLDME